jgi:hypothetical protein
MILVTGGCGFIGSAFVLQWLATQNEPVANLDLLTYAGRLSNLRSVQDHPGYHFSRGDIADTTLVGQLLAQHRPRAVVHFAAESHVDRSIAGPLAFTQTNVVGTLHLLEAVLAWWQVLPAERSRRLPLPERVHGRGVSDHWAQRTPPSAKPAPLRAQQPLFSVQGRGRPPGARLAPHLQAAHAHHPLLQQLRPAPVP